MYKRFWKRFIDTLLSLIAFIILSPLLLVTALAVRLSALDFDADAAGAHKVDAAARRERDFVRAGDFRLRKGCPHEVVQVIFALLDGGADAAQCVEDFCERIRRRVCLCIH